MVMFHEKLKPLLNVLITIREAVTKITPRRSFVITQKMEQQFEQLLTYLRQVPAQIIQAHVQGLGSSVWKVVYSSRLQRVFMWVGGHQKTWQHLKCEPAQYEEVKSVEQEISSNLHDALAFHMAECQLACTAPCSKNVKMTCRHASNIMIMGLTWW
jgi:hypothetical protein